MSAPTDRPLEIELLVPREKRRVSVEEHYQFRQSLFPPAPAPADEIDELVAELRSVRKEGEE